VTHEPIVTLIDFQIWRFYESKKSYDKVKSAPVPLHSITDSQFFFSSEEAYLIMLVYKNGQEGKSNITHKF